MEYPTLLIRPATGQEPASLRLDFSAEEFVVLSLGGRSGHRFFIKALPEGGVGLWYDPAVSGSKERLLLRMQDMHEAQAALRLIGTTLVPDEQGVAIHGSYAGGELPQDNFYRSEGAFPEVVAPVYDPVGPDVAADSSVEATQAPAMAEQTATEELTHEEEEQPKPARKPRKALVALGAGILAVAGGWLAFDHTTNDPAPVAVKSVNKAPGKNSAPPAAASGTQPAAGAELEVAGIEDLTLPVTESSANAELPPGVANPTLTPVLEQMLEQEGGPVDPNALADMVQAEEGIAPEPAPATPPQPGPLASPADLFVIQATTPQDGP